MFLALFVACGGVNTGDKQRRAGEPSAASDNDEPDDDADAGGDLEQTTQPTSPAPSPADAGAPDATEPVPAGSFAAGTDLETTADLNLRDGPGTDFNVLLTIPQGTLVKVKTTSGADGWVNIDHQGTVGYSSKTYLKEP